ncbi:MAG: hypothetical protein RMJ97_10230 [Raineya sp.]|nr:hypothetical protein [Raineya sp.]MDW8297243.1 hypothetical protein [Raineya sp.]
MQKHPVDKLFAEKFADFSPEPSTHFWENLETNLEQKKHNKGNQRYFWIALTTTILLVILAIVGWKFIEKPQIKANNNHFSQKQNSSIAYLQKANPSPTNPQEIKQVVKSVVGIKQENVTRPVKPKKMHKKDTLKEIQTLESRNWEVKNDKVNLKPTENQFSSSKDSLFNFQPNENLKANSAKDSIRSNSPKSKGTKIIIKLPEPEPTRESKARDFASSRLGKFLKNLQKFKEGEIQPRLNFELKN